MPLTYFQPSQVDSTFNGYLRNRIINGAMMIDQRNAGASVTNISGTTFSLDRWGAYGSQASKYTVQQNAGGVTPPPGFKNYAGITSLSSYTPGASEFFVFYQPIEGLNAADFGWGTVNAVPVVLSFWVRSSLTGTFSGSIISYGNTASYPFSYTINGANTWEYKTIAIPGPTIGTWNTNTSGGPQLNFNLGSGSSVVSTAGAWTTAANYWGVTGTNSIVGTNSATWYVTGVQLEVGSVATPFERRQYGTELMLCQRYWRSANYGESLGVFQSGANAVLWNTFQVEMRAAPTATFPSLTNSVDQWGTSSRTPTAVNPSLSARTMWFTATGMSGSQIGNPAVWIGGAIQLSAEL